MSQARAEFRAHCFCRPRHYRRAAIHGRALRYRSHPSDRAAAHEYDGARELYGGRLLRPRQPAAIARHRGRAQCDERGRPRRSAASLGLASDHRRQEAARTCTGAGGAAETAFARRGARRIKSDRDRAHDRGHPPHSRQRRQHSHHRASDAGIISLSGASSCSITARSSPKARRPRSRAIRR